MWAMHTKVGLRKSGPVRRESQFRNLWLIVCLAALCAFPWTVVGQEPQALSITNVRVIVGDGRIIECASLQLRNGQISFVGDTKDFATHGTRVIDGAGLSLMPGLIDAHVHLFAGTQGIGLNGHEKELTLDVPKRLKGYLEAGVTTIKSTGDPTSLILRLRDSLRSMPSSGPRLLVTGPGITAPQGWPTHVAGDDGWWRSEHCREVTTAREARETVRELAKQKVDAVKLYHDGGPLAVGGEKYPKLEIATVKAAIDESHRHNLRATVHTWRTADAIRVIEAGADGLEHGVVAEVAPPDLFQLLERNNAFYVPTLAVYRYANGRSEQIGKHNLVSAYRAQARIALGSDTFSSVPLSIYPPHGRNTWIEFELMASSGMTRAHVIQSATRDAAMHLGILDEVGTVEVGKRADVVLTRVDPLSEPVNPDDVLVVIRDGFVVRDSRPHPLRQKSSSD